MTRAVPGAREERKLPLLFAQDVGKDREAALRALRLRITDVATLLVPAFAKLRRKWGGVAHTAAVCPDEATVRRCVYRMTSDLEDRADQNDVASGGIFVSHINGVASIRVDDELYEAIPIEIRERLEATDDDDDGETHGGTEETA